MKQKHLSFKQRLLVAATLFGMFFGAGNLIFPVHLGQLAGRNLLPAMTGFILTAVGIPILGVAAIGNTHSDGLQALASRVGKRYGCFFTCLLVDAGVEPKTAERDACRMEHVISPDRFAAIKNHVLENRDKQ